MHNHAIVLESLVPLRREPAHAAELTTELLFGERIAVLEEANGWTHLRSLEDGYTGWAPAAMLTPLSEDAPVLSASPLFVQPLFVHAVIATGAESRSMPLCRAARMYEEAELSTEDYVAFRVGAALYLIGRGYVAPALAYGAESVLKIAQGYAHAPYRWGGKTPLGIDCSGLVQNALLLHGVQAPRDAWQQATLGSLLPFDAREAADLAFFSNEAGHVVHVGFLLNDALILHAAGSGHVRVDHITPEGILHTHLKTLTHRLHSIQRVPH